MLHNSILMSQDQYNASNDLEDKHFAEMPKRTNSQEGD